MNEAKEHMELSMERRKSAAPVIILLVLFLVVIIAGFASVFYFLNEIEAYKQAASDADYFFRSHTPQQFINRAVDAEPYHYHDPHEEALYFYEAPEGFTMISHSAAWDQDMLELLYFELLRNEHGDEINMLHEVIVYPFSEEEGNMLASYTIGTTAVSFFIQFPAFPPEFTVPFPREVGKITLYSGDTNTTIDSMANSLSHEYGHLYTFYYMLYAENNEYDSDENDSLDATEYAGLREASRFDLITNATPGSTYMEERHRYLFEIAAEDYVQLMGSPRTRQVVDFVDVQQILNGAQQPSRTHDARNAFPQENMMIPLAIDVPGLAEYFYSFIDAKPRVPIEGKKDVTLQIRRESTRFELVGGPRTFIYYTVTWNAPYDSAIYTLAYYDPENYTGWGIPVKTVHPGQTMSAVMGEYVVVRGTEVIHIPDSAMQGSKVLFVVALLPDGTFYISDKLEHNFD